MTNSGSNIKILNEKYFRQMFEEKIMLNPVYRPAKQEDAAAIVDLMLEASGGDLEFLLEGLEAGKTTSEMMLPVVEKELGIFSYLHSTVVENEGKIIGLMHACPTNDIGTKRNFPVPAERLAHMKSMFDLKIPDSYLLLYLSTLKDYRGHGIGHQLLKIFTSQAEKMGFKVLSLQAWADNEQAIKLYVSQGFKVVARGEIARHRLLPHDGGILLLRKDLPSQNALSKQRLV
jgi:GNAT superfamily N-acetyltransferase